MKLINADAIIATLEPFSDRAHGNQHYLNGIVTAKGLIAEADEAVVRCIDCKYMGSPNARGAYACKHSRAMVDALINGYCSYGEWR